MTAILEGASLAARTELLGRWDDELLLGGVMLSEWATFLIQDADVAFCAGADLAALLTAQAAMEAHLKHQYGDTPEARPGFAQLIDTSPLPPELRRRLHEVRRYRNRWVHVRDPDEDSHLIERPDRHRSELSLMSTRAMRLLREVIYLDQFV